MAISSFLLCHTLLKPSHVLQRQPSLRIPQGLRQPLELRLVPVTRTESKPSLRFCSDRIPRRTIGRWCFTYKISSCMPHQALAVVGRRSTFDIDQQPLYVAQSSDSGTDLTSFPRPIESSVRHQGPNYPGLTPPPPLGCILPDMRTVTGTLERLPVLVNNMRRG